MSEYVTVLGASPAIAAIPAASYAAPIMPIDVELLRLGVELEKAHACVKAAAIPGEDYPDDFVFVDDKMIEAALRPFAASKLKSARSSSLSACRKSNGTSQSLAIFEHQRWSHSEHMEDILAMETATVDQDDLGHVVRP